MLGASGMNPSYLVNQDSEGLHGVTTGIRDSQDSTLGGAPLLGPSGMIISYQVNQDSEGLHGVRVMNTETTNPLSFADTVKTTTVNFRKGNIKNKELDSNNKEKSVVVTD